MEMRVHEAMLRVAEMLPFGPLACRTRSPSRLRQTPVPQPNSNNLAHVRLPAADGVRHTENHHPITILSTTTLDPLLRPQNLDKFPGGLTNLLEVGPTFLGILTDTSKEFRHI